jgi:hypothetical protein
MYTGLVYVENCVVQFGQLGIGSLGGTYRFFAFPPNMRSITVDGSFKRALCKVDSGGCLRYCGA